MGMFEGSQSKSLLKILLFALFFCVLSVKCVEHKEDEHYLPYMSVQTAPGYDAKNPQLSIAKSPENFDDVQCKNGKPVMKNTFSWVDYTVVGLMLVISCGIGLFYGFFASKQTTSTDFLLGGSSMGTFPMAMSLGASFITAIELLGNPAEMYNHGMQFLMICIAFIMVVPLTSQLYLPVFMTLRLTSSYEYLSMRFNLCTRLLASGFYILQMVLYTSVAVYAPALALSHVTGLNTYIAVSVIYLVCIFYASQGGMKAVIIADTFQAAVLIGSILLIIYLGENVIGDAGVIWSQNYRTQRLELFNMNPSPTIRHSFWSVAVGGTFYWMTMFCSNQASIQKYMSVNKISQARKALWIAAVGLILVYTINFYTGMLMVAQYKNCDPLQSGEIHETDQLLPFYVMTVMGHLKGVAGFFVAGIFAASLGTVACALNSLAAVTMQDFVAGAFNIKLPESKGALWAKWISIIYGALSFGLVFVVEQLGSVMQLALSFNGMVGGVTLGLFSLGMFFPWANSKGAIVGALVAMALVSTMGLGQKYAETNNLLVPDRKPVSIEFCPCYNSTEAHAPEVNVHSSNEVFFLFRISYLWYSAIGFLVTVIIGFIVSLITGPQNPKDVDYELLSPPVREFLDSLSNSTKEMLNIPIKHNLQCSKDPSVVLDIKGIVNSGLDLSDEKERG